MSLERDGFIRFAPDARVARWAQAAYARAREISQSAEARATHLRHGQTWFVGVDALPTDPAGAIDGIPLEGPWDLPELPLHPAQLSIIYPGYPAQDPGQSDANHAFRRDRFAAHVDGLLPLGPHRRRYAREWHAYVLGIPLNQTAAAPTVVWRGSHRIMQRALRAAIGAAEVAHVDVTRAYAAARRTVFDTCQTVRLAPEGAGSAFLLHRFALHGTAPWKTPEPAPEAAPETAPETGPDPAEGRMVAFFRPAYPAPETWLNPP